MFRRHSEVYIEEINFNKDTFVLHSRMHVTMINTQKNKWIEHILRSKLYFLYIKLTTRVVKYFEMERYTSTADLTSLSFFCTT